MYGTIADWRAWAMARGNSAPTDAGDADATAALVRASDYIRARYAANLLQAYDAASLKPSGYDYLLVDEATYIAAGLELTTSGFFSKTYTEAEKKVLTGVESIKWTVTGNASGTYANLPSHSLIDAMFEPYVTDPDDSKFLFRSIGPETS